MIDGLVLVDKEVGWTSHDVVAKCRGIFGQKRVGHSGTLDPPATGLLLVGLGRVTRLLRFLGALPKHYVGEVVLGTETTTLDDTGEVTATHDMAGITVDEARAAAAGLTGDILQLPPMVSAVKVGGRRLHEIARSGDEVERVPRPVTVHRFAIDATADPHVLCVEVECSSGTYIRSLAADLGAALGGGAHLRGLRRTAIGSFLVDDAAPIDALTTDRVLAPAVALRDLPVVTVGELTADRIAHGARMDLGDGGPTAVLAEDGRLLAVYENGKPAVVLT
ncbi:MAG: truB [Acidimicrobiales bacterium]|nr:truB [Acidimicrobiales bacterium]